MKVQYAIYQLIHLNKLYKLVVKLSSNIEFVSELLVEN